MATTFSSCPTRMMTRSQTQRRCQGGCCLHCGDLIMIGGLGNYKKAIANLQAIDAELKLVIAGNHDVSLDPKWWQANLDEDDGSDEPAAARALFKAEEADGLYLLEEDAHSFTLSGNRRFTIYASPYTPEFHSYA